MDEQQIQPEPPAAREQAVPSPDPVESLIRVPDPDAAMEEHFEPL
jgi:hypothetical protein